MSNYRNQLESYLKTLDIKADRVLDVGGAANPVKDRVKSWQVKEYKIIDNGLEKGKFDVEWDLNKHWNQDELMRQLGLSQFDILFCLEVFEYLYQPKEVLNLFWEILRLNGILYATFPFIYPIHEPKENDYLRYTCEGAARLLAEAGFKILEIIPRIMTPKGFELWKEFMIAEGMHSSKHSRHDQLGFIFKAQKC